MLLQSNLCRCGTDEVVLVLTGEFLERLVLGLGEKEGREDTREHEQGEDLEDVVDPSALASAVLELESHDLSDDGTELSGRGRDSVGGGAVASGEDLQKSQFSITIELTGQGAYLSGNDESGGVGAEILEEVLRGKTR